MGLCYNGTGSGGVTQMLGSSSTEAREPPLIQGVADLLSAIEKNQQTLNYCFAFLIIKSFLKDLL